MSQGQEQSLSLIEIQTAQDAAEIIRNTARKKTVTIEWCTCPDDATRYGMLLTIICYDDSE